jgi:integrase
MAQGTIFKRCGCRNPETAKPYGDNCPKLNPADAGQPHGSWAYRLELPRSRASKRRQLNRSGFPTESHAADELQHARTLLTSAGRSTDTRTRVGDALAAAAKAGTPLPRDFTEATTRPKTGRSAGSPPTLADYLEQWIRLRERQGTLAESTIVLYSGHIRVHLTPHLGHLRLDELRVSDVREMLASITEAGSDHCAGNDSADPDARPGRRRAGPATRQRIRATLRTALNDAIADELITFNPAVYVKTPAVRQRPRRWTPESEAHWRRTGRKPAPVMIWTSAQTTAFLRYAEEHAPDLYPMFHFLAHTGVRRGEACGLHETAINMRCNVARIDNQLTLGMNGLIEQPPKSEAGNRDVYFTDVTRDVLMRYAALKNLQRQCVRTWPDTELFFVRPGGQAWRPDGVTQRFRRLIKRCDLPPIRIHDLRHGAASTALAAHIDIKVVQDFLGHSSSSLTRDTYQTTNEELQREAAAAIMATMR